MRPILILLLASAFAAAGPAAGQDIDAAPPQEIAQADSEALARIEAEVLALVETGDLGLADARLERLLDIELRVYGPNHPLVANTHAFRSDLAQRMGDLERAEQLRRLELPIREVAGDALALAEARRALGAILVALNRHEEASVLLEPALAVMIEQLAAADDRRISAAYNLGRSYYVLDLPRDALTVLAPAVEALSEAAHDGSAWAPLVAHEYGFILVQQGRHEEAVLPLRRACELWSPAAGSPGVWPGEACLELADALIALERRDEAAPWLELALADPTLSAGRRSNAAEQLINARSAEGGPGADEALLRTALDSSVQAWGADHAVTAYAANRLGLWLRRQDRHQEALELFEQSGAAYAADQGPAGQGVMVAAANVVYALNSLDRANEAVARAEVVQQGIDPEHLEEVAARAAWRSLVLAKTDALLASERIDDARAELRRLAEWLDVGDSEPALLADVQTRLAQAAARQLDWPAMVLHRRLALEHQQQVDNPRLLTMAMAHYGQVLGETGQLDAAYRNLGEALTLHTTVQDATEDERLYVMLHFGVVARRMGRLDEAEPLLEMVVARRREEGAAPGVLAHALNQLADVRVDRSRFEDAEALYLEALALMEGDAEFASYIDTDLGELWRFMGRIDEAEAALRRVVDYIASRYGPNDLNSATPLRNLSNLLDLTGRKERALDMLLQVQALEAAALEPHDPARVNTSVRIGRVLGDLGRLSEAEAILIPTLELAIEHLGGENPLTQEAASQLGYVAIRQARYAEGIELMRMTAELTERSFGPDSRQMINVLQILAYALYMEGRYDETITVMSRVVRLVDTAGARWPSTVVDAKSNLGRTYIEAGRAREALAPLREAATTAARLSHEQTVAIGMRADVSRAPFRALVQAAWVVSSDPTH